MTDPDNPIKVTWNDEGTKDLFTNSGIADFADFWNLEETDSTIAIKPMRQHLNRETGEVLRQMTRSEEHTSELQSH